MRKTLLGPTARLRISYVEVVATMQMEVKALVQCTWIWTLLRSSQSQHQLERERERERWLC